MSKKDKSRSWWQAIKEACGVKPTDVNGQDTLRTQFYFSELLELMKGRFNIECPEDWDKDFILNQLLLTGFFGVTDTPLGVVPCICAPKGLNIFQRPNSFTISGAELVSAIAGSDLERTLGVDGALVYLRSSGYAFQTVVPLLQVYAEKLATCDASIDVSLINSRIAYVFEVADGKQAEDAKKLYGKISSGEPAVFMRSNSNPAVALSTDSGFNFHINNVKNAFIAGDVQDVKRTIYNEFLTRIGLNNANTDKRERLNSDEVNANNDEIKAAVSYWKKNLKKCCAEVNRLFPNIPFNITIEESESRSIIERGEESGADEFN